MLRRLGKDNAVLTGMLPFVLLALVGAGRSWPALVTFLLSVGGIIPLAGLIGSATAALADRFGAKIGGLLNATFGNAPDLLVGVFGVQRGLIPLVKATLIGAIISNSALIMGICCIAAGLAHGRPRFQREEAGHHSVLMLLVLAAVLFPSVTHFGACSHSCGAIRSAVPTVSVAIAVVLLFAYIAYLAFGVFGLESLHRKGGDGIKHSSGVAEEGMGPKWPLWLSLTVLAGSAVALIPTTDILTANVNAATGALGWSQVFVGMVIVANAGNVAEGYAAIRAAIERPSEPTSKTGTSSGLDLAIGIASASSIQIAAFIAPLVVLYSLFSNRMSLDFSPIEIAILALLVVLFGRICDDGESNWLEGTQLLALYAMAAIVFFVLPVSAFGQ
jgi:Ca2+:H+ antiporter